MSSSGRCDPLDLQRGLPTTAEDVTALRRATTPTRLDLEDYLRFLAALAPCPVARAERSRGPRSDEPFTLLDPAPPGRHTRRP